MTRTVAICHCTQAGYFFPTNVTLYEEYILGIRLPFDKFATDYVNWLEGGFMNEACAAALGDRKRFCWDISVVQKYLKTPLFVAQNQIDEQQASPYQAQSRFTKTLSSTSPHTIPCDRRNVPYV